MPTARDMMLNLKEMFGEQGRSARQDVMRNLLNTKMAEGTLATKDIIKSKKHVLMVSARVSSKLKLKDKKMMKKNNAKHVSKGEATPRGVQIRGVPNGKCFHYGNDGYWKRNCPAFIANSESTNHVCNSLQGFQITKQLSDKEITLHMGTSASVLALAVGVVSAFQGNPLDTQRVVEWAQA
ncbi:hypothetical protein Acr_16g0000810 [Actinidia rufa]|uniref:Uncharacterized protein n=1 Tax=Actinidia rufa TaxID=165716 RepID=A0A7J0FYB4_9ERIC|nr:hypothetical protein Acr_16g0000810 [Actinidia rufa]